MSSQQATESARREGAPASEGSPGRTAGPGEFLSALLAAQCRTAPAESGAALRIVLGAGCEVVCLWPSIGPDEPLPDWVTVASHAAEEAVRSGAVAVAPAPAESRRAEGQSAWVVATPRKRGPGGADGAAAYLVLAPSRAELTPIIGRLDLTAGLLTAYELEMTLRRRENALRALRAPLEVVAAVNEHATLGAGAMRLCNEVATRWRCERVGLGIVRGGAMRLVAASHAERIDRRTRLSQDLEAAMEEAADQDVEVFHPDGPESMTVSRCAGDLSSRHGPTAVCVCPLRRAGGACAAIVVERPISDPFTQEEADALRLTCDLVAPRLLDLDEHGRWIGVRAARDSRRALAALVGPRHTWAKAVVALGFALLVFLSFARGTDWVVAPFTLEAVERRVVAAPFDAFVAASAVDVGASVIAGETLLAELDTTEHRLRLAAARAERSEHLTKSAAARNEGRTADARISQAEADRVQAEIDLLESRIAQARIVAPISGRIIAGELRRAVGAPVRAGDPLFEVAPLDTLRVEIRAPEGRAAEVKPGQRGVLAGASRPGDRVEFVVDSVDPVAEAREGRNAFTVRATVAQPAEWMRPGMSGVARIDAGSRRLISIWARPLVDYVRLRLWI